jgi:hypothetical protein
LNLMGHRKLVKPRWTGCATALPPQDLPEFARNSPESVATHRNRPPRPTMSRAWSEKGGAVVLGSLRGSANDGRAGVPERAVRLPRAASAPCTVRRGHGRRLLQGNQGGRLARGGVVGGWGAGRWVGRRRFVGLG